MENIRYNFVLCLIFMNNLGSWGRLLRRRNSGTNCKGWCCKVNLIYWLNPWMLIDWVPFRIRAESCLSKPVLPIRFILIWIRILLWIGSEKIPIFFFFLTFSIKSIFLQKMICYVIYILWGKYLCPLNKSYLFLKKMYDILLVLVDFCGNFPWFWLIFC